MSRRFSQNSNLSGSYSNLHSPSLAKIESFQKSLLKSSLRKSSLLNSLEDLPPLSCYDSDVFLKAYNNAKRKTVIISSALDDNIRGCIRKSIKNGRIRCTPGLINEALNPLLTKIEEYEILQNRKPQTKKKNSISNFSNPTSKPRFGSFLSKDGQYALLKSYEDIIVSELQSLYPELKNHLQRTKTTNNFNENMFRRSSNSSDSSDSVSFKSSNNSSRRTSNQSTSSEQGITSALNLYDPNKLRYSLTTSTSFFDLNDFNSANSDAEYEKKVKISQKLENAMELIDNLKLIRESKEKTNSKKNSKLISLNETAADSVLKYNEWRNEWTELIDMN